MRRIGRTIKRVLGYALVLVLAVSILGDHLGDIPTLWTNTDASLPHITSPSDPGELEVHFIDVGNADSILLISEGESMLIDAGENDNGDEVVSYLKSLGVTELQYAVGTHPHSDHIGGLDTVLYEIPTETLLMPEKEHTTKTYEDVLTAAEETGTYLTTAEAGDSYQLGSTFLTVLSPDRIWEDLNNNSIVLLAQNGEDSFLFAGDAESDSETVMLDSGIVPDVDVLKVGHHGSSTSSSYRWLRATMPEYCVITCGAGNKYGHPHKEVLSRLNDLNRTNNTTIFRSDSNGNITAHSDGSGQILWETEY